MAQTHQTKKAQAQPAKNVPALIAYYVPERENAGWIRIGAAWLHKDGKGFSLDLELTPTTGGRIALRAYDPKQTDNEPGEGA